MIEVKNLVKDFKSEDGTFRALDDLSFKVNRGKFTGSSVFLELASQLLSGASID